MSEEKSSKQRSYTLPNRMHTEKVLVYTDRILSGSATFIKAQAEHINAFSTVYVGTKRVPDGLEVSEDRCVVLNEGTIFGRFREGIFKVTGQAPLWKRKLRRQNANLIHAHFGPDGVMALPLAQSLEIPLLVTFHGYDATTSDEHARQSFYRHRAYIRNRDQLIQKADGFIAVSEFIKEKMIEQGIPEEKITVHYIGIDVDYFEPDAIEDREPVVLFVGRLTEKKGVHHLIRAMERVQREVSELRLVIIGDGERREKLKAEAARRLKSVDFLGFQPSEVVWDWMNRAMLLAVPSVTAGSGNSEGLPMVVLEGQAMGLPVVGSRHAGIPEAVQHGQTGFLSSEGDSAGLADRILQLVEDRSLRQTFGRNGRSRVVERFNLKTQVQALEKIYRSHSA
jgi:colanic acid/amylovoran biosynthesis glycosyltransferase